jgi:hypothetical protein
MFTAQEAALSPYSGVSLKLQELAQESIIVKLVIVGHHAAAISS